MWGWASRGREAATLYFRKSKLITSGTPTNVSLKGAFDPYLRAPTQESFWSIAVAPRRSSTPLHEALCSLRGVGSLDQVLRHSSPPEKDYLYCPVAYVNRTGFQF